MNVNMKMVLAVGGLGVLAGGVALVARTMGPDVERAEDEVRRFMSDYDVDGTPGVSYEEGFQQVRMSMDVYPERLGGSIVAEDAQYRVYEQRPGSHLYTNSIQDAVMAADRLGNNDRVATVEEMATLLLSFDTSFFHTGFDDASDEFWDRYRKAGEFSDRELGDPIHFTMDKYTGETFAGAKLPVD